ncbi:hypothetical protein [Micromonospora fluostatini]|uniref:hypothetical protein n=1 Tax=Micromonospora sp. JCM 30529 TaxID=3421643 RepID=UPI003D16923A
MNRVLPAVATLVALLAPAGSAPAPAPGGAPATPPRVAVPAGPLAVGQPVLVDLDGWPAGTVQIEVCGNDGRRGALDCATDRATHAPIPVTGSARVPVLLSAPPVACPCLLRVRTPTGTPGATVALPLAGVRAPAVTEAGPAELTLAGLRAVDRSGVGGWFGLPGELTLHLTLHNPGPTDVVDPPFSLLAGPAGGVPTIVAAPALGTVPAGQTRDYQVPVPLDAALLGRYEVHGRIEPPGEPLAFAVETHRRPWGLLVVPAVALVLLVSGLRRLFSRRSAR